MSAVPESDIDLMSETQLRNYAKAVTREVQILRLVKACCDIIVEFSETRPYLFTRNSSILYYRNADDAKILAVLRIYAGSQVERHVLEEACTRAVKTYGITGAAKAMEERLYKLVGNQIKGNNCYNIPAVDWFALCIPQ